MGSIQDRNGMDLREGIRKRWQEYTEEQYKKDLHNPDNHGSLIIHLEPDILECEVKWALGSIATNKASGKGWNSSWAISNPKRWCCESAALNMPENLENSAGATGLEKVNFHFNPTDAKSWLIWKDPDARKDWSTGREGDIRGWDGWMTSLTQWTRVWVNSGTAAWRAAVHGVAKSWTWLSNWTELKVLILSEKEREVLISLRF